MNVGTSVWTSPKLCIGVYEVGLVLKSESFLIHTENWNDLSKRERKRNTRGGTDNFLFDLVLSN